MENEIELVATIKQGNFIIDVELCPDANVDGRSAYGIAIKHGNERLNIWIDELNCLKTAIRQAKKAARRDRFPRLFDQAERTLR